LYRAKITGVKGFEKLIAIKKILPHLTSENALISSFIDEAKLAAFLQHPNIVQIYDFGNMEGSYYLAMEYLVGKDLKYIVEKANEVNNPISLEDALLITIQICNGLFYAHNLKDFHGKSLSIIHRDIGPQNIFITYDGQIKIIDFGIAKAANQSTITQTDLIKGKVAYMSPEQAHGEEIDHRSDIFSIGIILYELVTQKRMFVGDRFQVYTKVCEVKFEPPESAKKDLPPILYEILHTALAADPDHRYQSAEEMGSELEMFLSQLSDQKTTKGLAQYVKGLLREEADKEENAMREAARFYLAEVIKTDDGNTFENQETEIININELPKNTKSKTGLYATLALVLIISGILFTWLAVEKPSGNSNTTSALFSGQPNSGEASVSSSSEGKKNTNAESNLPELQEGMALLEQKRFTEAISFFENVLSTEPSKKAFFSAP